MAFKLCMYHTRKLKCSIIKTREPTSQFRAENITINSALSGWEGGWSPETHDCYPAGCDCHASFIKKKKKKFYHVCMYDEKIQFGFACF